MSASSVQSFKPAISVALIEDDAVLRNHLSEVVNRIEDFVLGATADTYAKGERLIAADYDVYLIDLALPDGSGLDLIRQARATKRPNLKIIVVSVFGDVRNVVEAIEAGADGYLLKGEAVERTERALRDVVAGGAPISPAVAGHILARVRRTAPPVSSQPTPATMPSLTEKETEVLSDLARGFTYKEVAIKNGISHHTVADHVKAIYRKLAVNSRSQAVFEAMQNGLIDLKG